MPSSEALPQTLVVPDLLGLDYAAATSLKRNRGLLLADPDPDAPPIANFWWEHPDLVVLTQDPLPGVRIDRGASVTVTLGPAAAGVGARVRRPGPPHLRARAEPDA